MNYNLIKKLTIGIWILVAGLILYINPIPLKTKPPESAWLQHLELERYELRGASLRKSSRDGLRIEATWTFDGVIRLKEDLYIEVDGSAFFQEHTGHSQHEWQTSEALRQLAKLAVEPLAEGLNPWRRTFILRVGKQGEEFPLTFNEQAEFSDSWYFPTGRSVRLALQEFNLLKAKELSYFAANPIVVNTAQGETEIARLVNGYEIWRQGLRTALNEHLLSLDAAVQRVEVVIDEMLEEYRHRFYPGALFRGSLQIAEPEDATRSQRHVIFRVEHTRPNERNSRISVMDLDAAGEAQRLVLRWESLNNLEQQHSRLTAYRDLLNQIMAGRHSALTANAPTSVPGFSVAENPATMHLDLNLVVSAQTSLPLVLALNGDLMTPGLQTTQFKRFNRNVWDEFAGEHQHRLTSDKTSLENQIKATEEQIANLQAKIFQQREQEIKALDIHSLVGRIPDSKGGLQAVRMTPSQIKDGTFEVIFHFQNQPDVEETARLVIVDSPVATALLNQHSAMKQQLAELENSLARQIATIAQFQAIAFQEAPTRQAPSETPVIAPTPLAGSFASLEFPQRQRQRNSPTPVIELFRAENSWVNPEVNLYLQQLSPAQLQQQDQKLSAAADNLLGTKYFTIAQGQIIQFERVSSVAERKIVHFTVFRGNSFSDAVAGEALVTAWLLQKDEWVVQMQLYTTVNGVRASNHFAGFTLQPDDTWVPLDNRTALRLTPVESHIKKIMDDLPNGIYLLRDNQWVRLTDSGEPLRMQPSGGFAAFRSARLYFNTPDSIPEIARGNFHVFVKGDPPNSVRLTELRPENIEGNNLLFEGDNIRTENTISAVAMRVHRLEISGRNMPEGAVQLQLIGPNRTPITYHLLKLRQ